MQIEGPDNSWEIRLKRELNTQDSSRYTYVLSHCLIL